MKKMAPILGLALVFFACSNGIKPTKEQQEFISEFKKETAAPLTIDSAFITRLDTLEAMQIPQLQKLLKDSVSESLAGQLKLSLEGCIRIEGYKQSGRYQNYVDSLDIGMLKDAMAFKITKLGFKPNSYVLLWGYTESSFPACPNYEGLSIIASYPNAKGGFTHVLVGEQYVAADAPLSMKRVTKSFLKDGEIDIQTTTTNYDGESDKSSTETSKIKLRISDGDLKLVEKNGVKVD